MLNLGYNHG